MISSEHSSFSQWSRRHFLLALGATSFAPAF